MDVCCGRRADPDKGLVPVLYPRPSPVNPPLRGLQPLPVENPIRRPGSRRRHLPGLADRGRMPRRCVPRGSMPPRGRPGHALPRTHRGTDNRTPEMPGVRTWTRKRCSGGPPPPGPRGGFAGAGMPLLSGSGWSVLRARHSESGRAAEPIVTVGLLLSRSGWSALEQTSPDGTWNALIAGLRRAIECHAAPGGTSAP